MQLVIDEREQAHIYSCLLVGNAEFAKIKKSLAKLNREDDTIDEEIDLNAKLRREFNPRAEEEAREKSRVNDPAQLDIEDAGSSGETGGMRRTVKGPGLMNHVELRDALLDLRLAVPVDELGALGPADFAALVEWVGMVVAAQNGAGRIPDEPAALAASIPLDRLEQLLAAGPWRVEEEMGDDGPFWAVIDSRIPADAAEGEYSDWYDFKVDAEIRAARLNRTELQRSDMAADEEYAWVATGPWQVVGAIDGESESYAIVAGREREQCDSHAEAFSRAARYNRSIAQRQQEAAEPARLAQAIADQETEAALVAEHAD